MSPRIGIAVLPGSLHDDAARAVRLAGAEPISLWYREADLRGVGAVIVPGGSTYGSYLRPGALARLTPLIGAVVEAARSGMPVLGVGTGFQVLCEAGLLPGAVIANRGLRFFSQEQELTVENTQTAWTSNFAPGAAVRLPLKTSAGQFAGGPPELDALEAEGRVVLRYADEDLTGSARGIGGVTNQQGNVVGIAASPENAVEAGFGPSIDGLGFFESVLPRAMAVRS